MGGHNRRQQHTVPAADVDDLLELRKIIGRDDGRRLRRVHLEHHALEARAFLGIGMQPVEQRLALQRLERDATFERAIEMTPDLAVVFGQQLRRRAHRVRRVRG